MAHICIIGNGIAGVTAARHIRKRSDHRITLISNESAYFFSRTALMYQYMGHMSWKDLHPYPDDFWAKNRIDLVHEQVDSVDFEHKSLNLSSGGTMQYDKLILATGSMPLKAGWPGQELSGVGCLYHKQDLEMLEIRSPKIRSAVVVGGGLIGVELAEMLYSRGIEVTLLVREPAYWSGVLPVPEAKMVSSHIRRHGIDLRHGQSLKEIRGDSEGQVSQAVTEDGSEINCQFLGLTIGVQPNIDLVRGTILATDKGILVDNFLKTNLGDVFAIGDCAQLISPKPGRRPTEAVWYTGRMMGKTVAKTICGSPGEYDPGIWFNSAKFFDLEYQVYGQVNPVDPPQTASLFWQHPAEEKSVRICYEKESERVTGFNLLGIRFRHEVCDRWIKTGTGLTEVISNIRLAFFDPEFYRDYGPDLIRKAREQTGKDLQLEKAWSLNSVLKFLQK
jgi:NADPH-dependent 2,4-dienoyl-CoA reductase/sulfur reductase-like enzyme